MNFIFVLLSTVSIAIALTAVCVYLVVVRQQAKYKTLHSTFEQLEREKITNIHNQSTQLKTFMNMNVQMANGPLAKILTLVNVQEQRKTLNTDELQGMLREYASEMDLTIHEINSKLQ